MLTSGVALLLACVAFVAYDRIGFRTTLLREATVQARIIGANTAATILFNDPRSAEETLRALAADPRVAWAVVHNPAGELFAAYARDAGAREDLDRFHADRQEGVRFGVDHLVVSAPILVEGEPIGVVHVQSDLLELVARTRRYVGIAAVVLVASLLLARIAASRLERRISGPVLRLVETAHQVSVRKDFSVRAEPGGGDELGLLVRTFNEMVGQIEARDAELSSARDELEQRVQERTRQLQAANRELEAYTYTVSHDLKAPLRGMEGFARALQEDYGERLEDTGRGYLGRIQTAARRMAEIIDDLLRYSRLERREMQRAHVALRPIVEDVSRELEEEMESRGLRLRVELDVEAVEAERAGLREALANLLGNAVKFSPAQGSEIAVRSRRDGGAVVLSVTDHGIGFDMRYQDRIFGMFERLHRQEDFPGTGVGLAIVRKVAERHGGRAWAVSEPGKGSTFYLALPAGEGEGS
jgi:signal transduction histidine kinase